MLVYLLQYQLQHIYFQPLLTKTSIHSKRFQTGFNQSSSEQIVFYDALKCIRRQYSMSLGIFMVQWVTHIIACQFQLAILENIFIMGSRSVDCYFIAHQDNEKYSFFGPRNEIFFGFKLLLNQRTRWYDYIEKVMKITNVNPNTYSESSAFL